MNADELKELWGSAGNGLPEEKARGFAAAAMARMERERRRRRGMLIYVFAIVPAVTLWVGLVVARRGGIEWAEAWPASLILAAQWVTAIVLWRIYRQQGPDPSPASPPPPPIRLTLEKLHAQARGRCRELQTLLGLFLAAAPLAFAAIVQLQANGKMRPNEAASAGVLFGAILLGMTGWFLFELFGRRLPERRYLETLLRDYQSNI